ncbi:MAG: tryptophan-rich sensory protein [Anaerolineae bacterium]|jgi:hypothetical protein|nr:tryptophan-rich sensory protein [Anaerolineae bacterium]
MKALRWINLVIFVLMVLLNYYAGYFEINGNTVGTVSDTIPSLFTPSGYVFSIWAVIYLGLGAFVVYGVNKKQADNTLINRIGPWFIINSILNMAWLVVWLNELWLISLVLMIAILVTLLVIYLRLNAHLEDVRGKDFWFILAPFSIYLGWISVATIANTSVIFVANGMATLGVSATFWTVIMMIVAALVSNLMVGLRRDWFFSWVVIWAEIGIAVANPGNLAIIITAIVVAVEQVFVLWFLRKNRPVPLFLGKKQEA